MSGTNASIPLQYNPQPLGPNLGAVIGQANQLVALQQAQQEVKRQNALRGILGAPDALDGTGQPKPETLSRVMGVDPNAGMKLQQNMLATQQRQLQMDSLKTKAAYDRADYIHSAYAPILEQYEKDVAAGMPEGEARRTAQEATTKTTQEMMEGGALPPEAAKTLPSKFDPTEFRRGAMQTQQYMQWWKEQHDDQRLKQQDQRDARTDARAGTTVLQDADQRPIVLKPNAPTGEPKATYLDGTPVPDDKLPGAHKMGTGTTSAAAADQARAERMARFNVEKKLGRPIDPDSTEDKAALDQETQDIITKTARDKKTSAATPAAADRAALENVTRADYEKELGHPVDVNDPSQKAELDRRVLAAEDKRRTDLAGSTAGARIAAAGGNDRQAQEKIVRQNMENELGRPLTPQDDAEVSKRVLANEDARKVNLAGAATTARTAAQQALAKPLPVVVNGVAQDAIWKDGKYFNLDGTPLEGKVVGTTRAAGKTSPGQAVEDDAMAIAAKNIAAKEVELGRPLDQAERSEIRRDARIDTKVQEAAKKLDANAISDDAAKLIAEESLRGDWHGTVGMGRNQASMRKVAEWRGKLAKDQGLSGADLAANTAEFNGIMAAERVLGTRGAGIDLGISEAQKFAPMVLQLSDKIKNTGQFPTVNSMMLAIDKGTGGEDVVRLVDALNAYKMAYTQILTRGGMPTDDARRRSDEIIDKSWSNGQIHAAIDQLNKEMMGARSAVPEVRDNLYFTLTGKHKLPQADQQGQAAPVPKITNDAAGRAAWEQGKQAAFAAGRDFTFIGPDGQQHTIPKPAQAASTPQAAPAAQTMPAQQAVPKQGDAYQPTTQAQFDALQPGDVYINPADGKKYRKK